MTICAGVYRSLAIANKNPWTDEEMRYLLNNCAELYVEDMAEHLNRTFKATLNKAYRMGLTIKTKPKGNEL